ncbi:MAG: hypothetical protein MUF21_13615 [Gemmatimonadaceae bacterium]|jgi:hypothetical protein|nr:hypothetical protein [Gemmatimonadaceae bacterium]
MTGFLDALLARSFTASTDGARPRPRLRFEGDARDGDAPDTREGEGASGSPDTAMAPPITDRGGASDVARRERAPGAAPIQAVVRAESRPVAREADAHTARDGRERDTPPPDDTTPSRPTPRERSVRAHGEVRHAATHARASDASAPAARHDDRAPLAHIAQPVTPVRPAPSRVAEPADARHAPATHDAVTVAPAVRVEISIGRIEIGTPPRAPAPPRPPAPAAPRPGLGLDAYLARRTGHRP